MYFRTEDETILVMLQGSGDNPKTYQEISNKLSSRNLEQVCVVWTKQVLSWNIILKKTQFKILHKFLRKDPSLLALPLKNEYLYCGITTNNITCKDLAVAS